MDIALKEKRGLPREQGFGFGFRKEELSIGIVLLLYYYIKEKVSVVLLSCWGRLAE